MQQPPEQPITNPADDARVRALAAIGADIDRLDELGLADERGRVIVEPASAFHWS